MYFISFCLFVYLFIALLIYFACFVCIYISMVYVSGSHRGHRRHLTSWKRCYWQLWATMWVLGTEPRPSVRASMAKQSPSSRFGFLNLGFSMWFWLASNSWSFFLPQPLELRDYRQLFPSQDKYVLLLLLLEVLTFLLFVFSLFCFLFCLCFVLFCFVLRQDLM